MRNQQQESGSRYQFRLHPAATTIEEEQQQQNNHNNNNNVNINSKDNNNKCMKAPMSASMKSLTGALAVGGAAALKDANTAAMMQRKQFTPTSDASNASFSSASVAGSIQDDMSDQCSLTQAGLEEYNIRSSSYYDQPVLFHHQKQSSYAQSEGYHSYVSSSDSSSATPFLDRLRQESELLSRQSHHWSQNDLSSVSCNSVAPSPTPILLAMNGRDGGAVNSSDNCGDHQQQQNNSSESTSSTETLKWLGSMSDVSEASHVTGYSAISESVSSSQLIVHSSRVRTPKRHHSESVLYLNNELQHSPQQQPAQARQHLYAQPHPHHQHPHHNNYTSPAQISPTLLGREPSPTVSLSSSQRINPHHRHSPSYPPLHTIHSHSHTLHAFSAVQPPKKESISMGSPNSSLADSSTASNSCPSTLFPATGSDSQQHQSSISVTLSSSEAVVAISPQPVSATACSESASKTASNSANDTNSAPALTTAATQSKIMPLSIVTGSNMPPTAAASSGSSSSSSSSASSTATGTSATSPLAGNSATSYRSNHRLFPVSTYTEPVHSNTSQYVQHPKPQYSSGLQKPVQQQQQQQQPLRLPSPSQQQQLLAAQPSWQSVAELINDFERTNEQHPQKYSYIDPSKTHRVSNPALKAFQKNAVQSYFERQQQQQQHQHHQLQQQQHSKENNQQKTYQMNASQQLLQQQQILRPHSFQPTASAKEIAEQPLLRNSLPNTFSTAATTPGYQQLHSPHMRGQHDIGNPTHCSNKPPSPAPPPPPPRTRSLMPTLLRRSSSASDYAEFRDQYTRASQEKLQAQSVKNISSSEKSSFNDCGMPPPPPPPRGRASLPPRRTSSASEYAAMRDKVLQQQAAALAQHRNRGPHQYYAPAPSALATHAQPTENWVPERPPKNPSLRVPSPDLPPPPTEVDTSLSDEPLPPPPPEILHHQAYYEPTPGTQTTFMLSGELLPKPPSPNRRNSFAGSSTRKSSTSLFNRSTSTTSEQLIHATPTPPPPIIPKKPLSIELLQASKPASSIAQQCNKAHKVILNGSSSQPQTAQTINSSPPPLPAMSKINLNRKRPHNPAAASNIPPILEYPTNPISNSNKPSAMSSPAVTNAATSTAKSGTKCSPPPPPLKPRMPFGNQGTAAALSNKLRCNSKASYLPRQSLEKLNNTDPDHGSYKLTLTSNEDLVGHTKPAYDILAHNAKLPSNLPDVLPLGAKFQAQPASPTSANSSPLRYSSSSNLSTVTVPTSTQQQPPNCYSPMYPAQHRYSTPAMTSSNNYYNHTNNNNQAPNYTRSQSYDVNSNACTASPTKFMSQSTFDLKKTHNLETTLEETTTTPTTPMETSQILSPAQSENNLSSSNYYSNKISSITSTTTKPPSPLSARSEFTRNDMSRTLSLEQRSASTEGRIVRAELVNTTLPISPGNAVNKVAVTRKDSLRENIEKITQLQSQLMSAHLSDNGLLSNFGVKSAYSLQSPKAEVEELIVNAPTGNEERVSEPLSEQNGAENNLSTCDATQPPALPKTPPPTQPESEAEEFNEVIPAQISQMDSDIDGLKLIQRSEIILRVNPTTVETASQTDDLPDCDMGRLTESHQHLKEDAQTRTTLKPRQRHPIELDCEQISKELAELLAPNDKLIEILTPSTIKSPADYVSNLYNPDVPQRPSKHDVGTSTLMRMKSQRETMCDPTEKSSVTVELQYAETEVALSNGSESDNCDMLKKKVDELIKQLKLKLKILNREQATIGDESAINDELGSNLVEKLADKVRPLEATKFRTYIDDVGHITSLLLSLSERLAKAENMLFTIEADNDEKNLLVAKRDRLLEQLEEAKRLKEDIERRGTSLAGMLEKNLSTDEFADFDFFINMKAKLIADNRDIADKIKCGEEQLYALSESLMQSDC